MFSLSARLVIEITAAKVQKNRILVSLTVPPAAHALHQQVGHMAAPTSDAKRTFKLANGEPSTHGR
jgi:hypothetical protein